MNELEEGHGDLVLQRFLRVIMKELQLQEPVWNRHHHKRQHFREKQMKMSGRPTSASGTQV